MSKISVVVNTLNEERNLPYLLRSVVTWVDEIVVVDMHSDDRTVEIAEEFGARVIYHERVGFADPARRFAISHAQNEWVLMLDADELVPKPLSVELGRIASTDAADIVWIPYLNYLMGAPIQTGWGPPDYHARFFKKSMMRTSSNIHAFLVPDGQAHHVKLDFSKQLYIAHFNYRQISEFLIKLDRYTTIEAEQAYERGERATYTRLTYYCLKEVLSRYIKGKGYRDGWRGVYLTLLMMTYRISSLGKLKELEVNGKPNRVDEAYAEIAEQYLESYRE